MRTSQEEEAIGVYLLYMPEETCLWLDTVKQFLQCPHGTPTVGYVAHCRQSPNFLTKPIHKLK